MTILTGMDRRLYAATRRSSYTVVRRKDQTPCSPPPPRSSSSPRPGSRATPAAACTRRSRSTATRAPVVYFEVEPGEYLPTHTDSAEEILYIVQGEGEALVGEERGIVRAGDLAVIPEMVPHGIANVGEETLKVVGFFCDSHIVSTFAEPLQPMDQATITMGAPVAVS